MKILSATIIAILSFTITCSAQWTTSGTTIYNSNTGNVGVGTTTPTLGKLQVQGVADVLSLFSDGNVLQFNGWANNDFRIIQRTNAPMTFWTNTIERMRIDQSGNVGIGTTTPAHLLSLNHGGVLAWRNTANNSETVGFGTGGSDQLIVYTGGVQHLTILANGNLGIGTTNPDQALAVNGTVHSKAVVVDNNVLPDYVFNKTYALRPLSAVKTYIDLNHHLPEMPSAAEVAKNGQNLGEINTLLLKKVEELTLYMIELNKTVKAQQQEIEALKKKN
ncbi:hypothetical protein [Mucilaginibacter flavidus]|uniref:hypothetical protein n=1 Tax=Mucilaginibacter flavidus TaxID=2949309 RepID=UPI0020922362|nr:hypothetical protein [Mucilaginibacter flavidus]MCO5949827.1 hypothetical protein [Mucilaginibacter flavidus]